MKTIKQHFEEIKDPVIRKNALNVREHLRANWELKVDSLFEAFNSGFYWFQTEQGHQYWERIAERAEAGETI